MTKSFFAAIPTGEGHEVLDDPAISLSPSWSGPPWHGQPEPVAVLIDMGRSASTAVQVVGANAYPEGVVLHFMVAVRETAREPRSPGSRSGPAACDTRRRTRSAEAPRDRGGRRAPPERSAAAARRRSPAPEQADIDSQIESSRLARRMRWATP